MLSYKIIFSKMIYKIIINKYLFILQYNSITAKVIYFL